MICNLCGLDICCWWKRKGVEMSIGIGMCILRSELKGGFEKYKLEVM